MPNFFSARPEQLRTLPAAGSCAKPAAVCGMALRRIGTRVASVRKGAPELSLTILGCAHLPPPPRPPYNPPPPPYNPPPALSHLRVLPHRRTAAPRRLEFLLLLEDDSDSGESLVGILVENFSTNSTCRTEAVRISTANGDGGGGGHDADGQVAAQGGVGGGGDEGEGDEGGNSEREQLPKSIAYVVRPCTTTATATTTDLPRPAAPTHLSS